VQRRRVGRTAADHTRDRDLGGELLQVERLALRRDVLGGDHGALDHEDVEAGLDRDLVVLGDALGRERARGDCAGRLDLLDALGDELGLDRLLVDPLHQMSRLLRRRRGDLHQLRVRVLVAGPDPLEVQNSEAAELVEGDRRLRADHAVHRGGEQRQLEPVGAEGPGDVDVVGIAGAP
jgi:hypothetical protein